MTARVSPPKSHPKPCPSVEEAFDRATEIAEYCAANAASIDRIGAFPVKEFEQIAEAGLLTVPLRSKWGGLGLGIDANLTHEVLILLKRIGSGNLAVGRIYEGHVNALQLVQTFGTAEQIQRYASDARDRHKIFGVWNAEAGDGVKIIPLDNNRYRLEGCKTFCSGAGFVERPFVNGVLPDGGWQMCIVPMEDVATVSDRSWWQPSGMRATASYKIDFTGVELDATSLIGNPDDYHRQPWLTAGVIRFAAVQFGAAEALFNQTRAYLQHLNYTGSPYQQERLGKMAIAVEQGNLWLQGAAQKVAAYSPAFGGCPEDEHPQVERLVGYTNMMRSSIEQICMDAIQICERCVGTRGLMPAHPMERTIRDLTLYLRQPAYDAAIATVGQYVLSQSVPASSLWSDD